MRPPSVDTLARSLRDTGLPHPLLVDCARRAIAIGEVATVAERARDEAESIALNMLRSVINATGVLLHTNLGRAPVAWQQRADYTNLEFDLATGQRGSRHAHAAALIARACGAEAALIVNNCAAAVLLVLAALADGREVLVSRGEAVEIGGGFRIPEVMAQSGARLVDVGTTNRTRLADYARAVKPAVALVMKVHTSNYRVEGFVESTSVEELASLGVPVVVDIGSGLLDAACPWLEGGSPAWVANEMAAVQTLKAGAALVTFSGDKLFGGPQSGIIAGQAGMVAHCARHPLARALRPGGLVLAALQETALAYLRRDGSAIALWEMAARTVDQLKQRANAIGVGRVEQFDALPGGGTLPGATIPSAGLVVDGDHLATLRSWSTPIVARVRDDRTFLDLRTVTPADDPTIAAALAHLATMR